MDKETTDALVSIFEKRPDLMSKALDELSQVMKPRPKETTVTSHGDGTWWGDWFDRFGYRGGPPRQGR